MSGGTPPAAAKAPPGHNTASSPRQEAAAEKCIMAVFCLLWCNDDLLETKPPGESSRVDVVTERGHDEECAPSPDSGGRRRRATCAATGGAAVGRASGRESPLPAKAVHTAFERGRTDTQLEESRVESERARE